MCPRCENVGKFLFHKYPPPPSFFSRFCFGGNRDGGRVRSYCGRWREPQLHANGMISRGACMARHRRGINSCVVCPVLNVRSSPNSLSYTLYVSPNRICLPTISRPIPAPQAPDLLHSLSHVGRMNGPLLISWVFQGNLYLVWFSLCYRVGAVPSA